MRIAITGITGYLGRLLFERLERETIADEIIGIDVAPSLLPPSRLTYICRDVRDPAIEQDLRGCDVVVHLAFIVETLHDRSLMYDINVNGSRNVLEACERAGVPNVVVASSIAAYGIQHDTLVTEKTPCLGDSRSYYAHSKRLLEDALDVFEARNPRTRVARLRPEIFVGPRCNTWAVDAMGMAGRFDTRGGLACPIIHEEDVVDAFFKAIVRPVRGAFLIAHREPLTLERIAALSELPHRRFPEAVALSASELMFRLRLTRMNRDWLILMMRNSFRYDPSWTEKTLDWKPRHTAEEAFSAVLKNHQKLSLRDRLAQGRVDRIEGTRFSLQAS